MSKKRLDLSGTPNLRDLLVEARRLGLVVGTVPRTGEVRVVAPWGRMVTLNNRRKDGARALIVLLREAQRREKGTTE